MIKEQMIVTKREFVNVCHEGGMVPVEVIYELDNSTGSKTVLFLKNGGGYQPYWTTERPNGTSYIRFVPVWIEKAHPAVRSLYQSIKNGTHEIFSPKIIDPPIYKTTEGGEANGLRPCYAFHVYAIR